MPQCEVHGGHLVSSPSDKRARTGALIDAQRGHLQLTWNMSSSASEQYRQKGEGSSLKPARWSLCW
eukprot:14516761-Alexandrium_andersonii.AAC.1